MRPVTNFMAFQLGWLACVVGAAQGAPWLGPAVALGVVGMHLIAVTRPRREGLLLGSAALLGLVLDSMLSATGLLIYANGQFIAGLAPYWILAMWPLFATTLNISLRWLHRRFWLASLLGAVGGPLSYLAGARLGAVTFGAGHNTTLVLAVAWSAALPFLVWLARRFDGVPTGPVPEPIRAWVSK